MVNKDQIQKINNALQHGDKARIARRAGTSKVTVNNFFNGRENELTEFTCSKIQKAANKIISDRQKREKANTEETNSLLK